MLLRSFILAMLLGLICACSTLSSIASYTVTEHDIEQGLLEHLDQLSQKTSVAGIPVMLSVSSLEVIVGQDNRSVVALRADAIASVSVFGLRYPAKVKLGLEGEPYYNQQEKALYVRSLTLTRSEIDAAGFKGNLTPLADRYMGLFNSYLATHPVYQIDTTKGGLAWLGNVPLNMEIVPGKITFLPQFNQATK
ncbi:DUF1439 domain-containing protein [Alteromonas alba]|jgi:hypothetical protein|uniref:DUF1439 domain-containing protein n=1 Tax=Alteromonas alba TaxID=2079529 RepID=A0A2S9V7Y7_9ALTE|nr:DUF1439 domain-containing protein [Alteromonas alba]MAX44964.1 hypothetical protein [Alteromonadaceae bacterium]PRO72543.1 DUF1439 domain-containing protein [Alteromonas alba]|tara:strand:- start:305 stop:883 length:579 start_codon:yes stop_codon:yes gene_type:complete